MKLNTFLFAIIFLPLYHHCNNLTGSNQTNQSIQQAEINQPHIYADNKAPDTTFSNSLKTNGSINKNPFGILIDKTNNLIIPIDKKIQVAKALGLNYMRAHAYISTWNGIVNNYDAFTAAGFKIILNINYGIPRNATGDKDPVPFPTDLQAYSRSVNLILDKYKPELVVIENEEDNPGYHAGSANDYINELKTAIYICHAKGLKVTNGGLTVREMTVLVYDDLIRNGKTQLANDFAQRAFPPAYFSKLDNYQTIPQVQRALSFGKQVLQAYKTLNLDYVNFHWYEPVSARGAINNKSIHNEHMDAVVFAAVVNYLKKLTGKPVITNEFGLMNTSPALITELMQKVLDANMDYAIFYSGDGAGGSKALQNNDASLRENGIAVKDFIKQHCQ